jgi:diguanylate cyclase (GGDEF)-like protein
MNAGSVNAEHMAIGIAVDAMPIGVAATRAGGRIEYANRHLCRVLGLTADELNGLGLAQFRVGMPSRLQVQIRRAMLAGETWQGEIALKTRRTEPLHVLESCYPEQEQGGAHVRTLHFFHELGVLRSGSVLGPAVFRDAVTGLPSRALLEELLLAEIPAARRQRLGFALLYVDIEHFNCVNLVLDRAAGDELLRRIAQRMRGALRASDTLARVGSDEFAVLLPEVAADSAILLGEKLRRVCSGWYAADEKQYIVRVSVGSSVFPGEGETPDDLLRRAEAAMYRFKAADREIFGLLASPVGSEYLIGG